VRTVALLLTLSIGLSPAVSGEKDSPAAKELAKLQGTWKRASVEVDGKKPPPQVLEFVTLTVEGDRYTLEQAGQKRTGTLKLDPTKTPKQIDFVETAGPDKGKTFVGIYEIDGDTWRYCLPASGKVRPREFDGAEGSRQGLYVNKRRK
jgi:uncharacterized protein (TIGR03067 family)